MQYSEAIEKNPAYSIFYEYLIATDKYKTQGTYPTPRQEDFVYYNISFYVFILHKFIYKYTLIICLHISILPACIGRETGEVVDGVEGEKEGMRGSQAEGREERL